VRADQRHVLEPDIARRQRLGDLRQRLELTRDGDPFGGRPSGQITALTHPGHRREGAVGLELPGFIEAPQSIGERPLQRVDPDFPDLNQPFAEVCRRRRGHAAGHAPDSDSELSDGILKVGHPRFHERP
jgi:hypothetical protein